MPYRFPSEPLIAPRLRRSTLMAGLVGLAVVIAFAAATSSAQAAKRDVPVSTDSALSCKPAITGRASSPNDEWARSKATYSWLSRVESEYGRTYVDVNLTRNTSWLCGRAGKTVTCQVAAEPCRLAM
jgi:hypothetical protein